MKHLVVLLAALLAVPAFSSCATAKDGDKTGSAETPTDDGARRDAGVDALKAALDADPATPLFDVRTRSEYFAAHGPQAVLLPLAELQAGRRSELEPLKGKEIWLICQSGGRSGKAADLLAGEGYTVVNVTGGTGGWIEKGYPVE